MPSVIILFGPPGSGKGTQAKQLSKKIGLPHISTGDLFRENMANLTSLGEKAKFYINQGKLVPDDLVLDMLFERVGRKDCSNGYLLDGFPRTIPQAKALEARFSNEVRLIVLNLDVSDEVIVKRIEGRLLCRGCDALYNRYFSPPKQEGKCDACGNVLYHREDDSAEVVLQRLKVYNEQTKPLIQFYEDRGILHHINGEQAPEIVFNKLIGMIKE